MNKVRSQITKDKFLKVLESEKAAGSITSAALLAGVSRQTIYNWRKEDYYFDEAVIEAIHQGKAVIADMAEQALIKKIKDGDTTAIIFTLKTLKSNYYGEREERKDEERKLNRYAPEAESLKTPERAALNASMYITYCKLLAEKGNVYTPEIKEMFEKLSAIASHYQGMLSSR